MAKKYEFQNQMIIGLMFGILLFCGCNGCLHREGMLGGMVVEGMREGVISAVKSGTSSVVGSFTAVATAFGDGLAEGQANGAAPAPDPDMIV